MQASKNWDTFLVSYTNVFGEKYFNQIEITRVPVTSGNAVMRHHHPLGSLSSDKTFVEPAKSYYRQIGSLQRQNLHLDVFVRPF